MMAKDSKSTPPLAKRNVEWGKYAEDKESRWLFWTWFILHSRQSCIWSFSVKTWCNCDYYYFAIKATLSALKLTILGGFDVSAIRQKSPFLEVFSHGCSTVKISIVALHKNVSPNLIMFLLIITASGPCRTDQPDCPQWQQFLFTASSQLLHSTVISQNFP